MSLASAALTADLFRAILDREPVGVALFAPAGDDFTYIYLNPIHQALKASVPMLGRTYTEVWPELVAFALEPMRRVLASGQPWTETDVALEIEVEPGRREERHYAFQVSRIDIEGRHYVLDVSEDITAEARALRGLHDSLDEQRALAEELAGSLQLQEKVGALADALNRMDDVVHSTLRIDEIMNALVGGARDALGTDAAVIELRGDGGWPVRYESGLSPRAIGRPLTPEDPVISRTIARTGDLLAVEDAHADVRFARMAREHGIRSLAGVPLIVRGETFGVLVLLELRQRRRFSAEEFDFLRRLGASVSLALENARLYDASQRALARTGVLREVAEAAATLDAYALGRRTLETLQRLIGLRSGVLYLLDAEHRVLHNLAVLGYSDEVKPAFDEVPLDEQSVSGRSVLHDEELLLRYDELPAGTRRRAELAGETDSVWIVMPVHQGGETIGNLTLVFDPERRVDAGDVALFRSVSDQIGVALRNAQLFESERESSRLTSVLAEIDERVHSSLEVSEIVKGALAMGARAIGAERAAINGIEGGGWKVWFDWGFDPSLVGTTYTNEQRRQCVESVRTASTIAVEDTYTDARVDAATMKAQGVRSAIVAPLIIRGEALGSLCYNYASGIHRFSSAEVEFVSRIGSTLSLALENARLYESQRSVADTLQESLLTLPDTVNGIEFAHVYHSAAETARVGGDFYDLFELERGLLGITVGDIAGKGLHAAVLTSLVKNAVRAQATEGDKTPAEVLDVVNTVVLRATPAEVFATVFFGLLDRTTGTLRYSSAGHTTGAIVHADGGIATLPADGPLLGAFANVPFGNDETCVEAGDLLFLYTDGLTEARRNHELFGEERLFRKLAELAGSPPREMTRRVLETAVSYAGGELSDDLAILTLCRCPSPA